MADYTATAVSEGDHWVIDVPGVGSTQADSVEDLEGMARDLVVEVTPHCPRAGAHRAAHRLIGPRQVPDRRVGSQSVVLLSAWIGRRHEPRQPP
jgi:hypothetical protein